MSSRFCRSIWTIIPALACVFAVTSFAGADEVADGRSIAAKSGSAVVKLQLVVKMSIAYEGRSGGNREAKTEATGTFVDPSGLLVTSLSQTNPADTIGSLMGESSGMKVSSQITDLKIRMADGKEIPGKVVLRDKDLDLVFIRPAQKLDAPVPYVDLTDSSSPELLDQIVIVNRLSKAANRTLSVSIDRVQSVMEKPRKSYSVSKVEDGTDLGSPVFTIDGKVVGLLVLRMTPMSPSEMSDMSASDHVMAVVLPAQYIATVAAQAPEKALEEPKAPAAKSAKPAAKPAVKPAAGKHK